MEQAVKAIYDFHDTSLTEHEYMALCLILSMEPTFYMIAIFLLRWTISWPPDLLQRNAWTVTCV